MRFSKQDIPHNKYISATAIVCKAVNRISKRGLAVRLIGGIRLTDTGEQAAREINIVGSTTTRARE